MTKKKRPARETRGPLAPHLPRAKPPAQQFSMQDEARNTGHSRANWSRDAKLRNAPVTFVNAGVSEPLKELEPQQLDADPEGREGHSEELSGTHQLTDVYSTAAPLLHVTRPSIDYVEGSEPDEDNELPRHMRPDFDGVMSDSSDEVVVFTGRAAGRRVKHQGFPEEAKATSDDAQNAADAPGETDKELDEGDGPMSDYLANLESDDFLVSSMRTFSQRELGGSHTFLDAEESSQKGGGGDESSLSSQPRSRRRSSKAKMKETRDRIFSGDPDEFPSATKVADALEAMALEDADVVSLLKTRRSKGRPMFNVSDSELEEALGTTFENDRQRKKERRQQREALRSQGSLGKQPAEHDLRTKYKDGMSFDQFRDELVQFLLMESDSLILPPLPQNKRKAIHEIANRLKVKSKSSGAGENRYPILYRTARTVEPSGPLFEKCMVQVARYFGVKNPNRIKSSTGGKGGAGRGQASAVSYRDGEVVGGSAPELGVDNRGRTMLEKMGWSQGLALGADHNKGILQPVAHVVKRTKAGLG